VGTMAEAVLTGRHAVVLLRARRGSVRLLLHCMLLTLQIVQHVRLYAPNLAWEDLAEKDLIVGQVVRSPLALRMQLLGL
jgi:hypothetical protein